MRRPRLLLLYCNAGGGTIGYARAGFDVVGVDILNQPNNPAFWYDATKAKHGVSDASFSFIKGDAITVSRELRARGEVFDSVHASPPCQAYSWAAKRWTNIPRADLLEPTRGELREWCLPYVIENVVGAPMHNAIVLCGLSFDITGAGLHNGVWPEVLRHRQFETNWALTPPDHTKHISGGVALGLYCTVAGHGGENARGKGGRKHKQRAMGIDWMSDRELNESIPPAYLEHVGQQLVNILGGLRRTDDYYVFVNARSASSRKWNFAVVRPPEFFSARAWLSDDQQTGFMVTSEGELLNLFNHGARGAGAHAVQLAIACGARHLNCFDGFLPRYYAAHGFVETKRVAFDDQYAPTGWNHDLLGRPDVVYMEHQGFRKQLKSRPTYRASRQILDAGSLL